MDGPVPNSCGHLSEFAQIAGVDGSDAPVVNCRGDESTARVDIVHMFDYHMRQSGAHAEEERSLTMARTASKAKIPTDASKEEALKITKEQIRKKYGDGSIMRLGDEDSALDVEVIPTGALALDAALGIGGVPRGRIVEIYGPESSGKTTLSLQIVAEAQALGGVAAFIDAEHALDPVYAAKIGVDIDELLISQPDTGEQALEICDMLVRSNAVSCIVIDSVAALVPRAEIEGEIGDASVGLQARLMSQALRKLAGSLSKSNTCCIFINQLREKIGVMFGSPETTTGGRAPQVLLVRAPRHQAYRDHQGRRRCRRKPRARQSRQEQVLGAFQASRVRHHVRHGHIPRGQHPRHGRRRENSHQVWFLVHLWRRAPGTGARGRKERTCREPRPSS